MRGLLIVALAATLALPDPSVVRAQTAACGNEALVARERAGKLRSSVETCRRYLAQGASFCDVRVAWKGGIHIPTEDAERLAADLEKYAEDMEVFDRRLAEFRGHYDVVGRGTVSSEQSFLKCRLVSSAPSSDATQTCIAGCFEAHSAALGDCWRDDVRPMGLCLINEGGRLLACERNCRP
jgi:hypothetical protein